MHLSAPNRSPICVEGVCCALCTANVAFRTLTRPSYDTLSIVCTVCVVIVSGCSLAVELLGERRTAEVVDNCPMLLRNSPSLWSWCTFLVSVACVVSPHWVTYPRT